jgi:hypothetical protein
MNSGGRADLDLDSRRAHRRRDCHIEPVRAGARTAAERFTRADSESRPCDDGAGIAGFLQPPFPAGDAPPKPWRFCWLGVLGVGFALLIGPEIWRSWRRKARTEGDPLFFLRLNTNPHDWRPKHFVLLGAFGASAPLTSLMTDNWWQLVAWIPFIVLLGSLRILPIQRGRRPPNTLGSAAQP